jgi:transcriptional regulator with XRE-family HTH domain
MVLDPDWAALLPQAIDQSQMQGLEPGKLLRLVRTTMRMTLEQLGKRSGVDQAHITRMESGRIDAQWKTWVRLFEALGCRLVPRVQAPGGLDAILEDRIRQTAQRNVARGEKLFPDKPLSEADRQKEEEEWMEILRGRRTSEIWVEEE